MDERHGGAFRSTQNVGGKYQFKTRKQNILLEFGFNVKLRVHSGCVYQVSSANTHVEHRFDLLKSNRGQILFISVLMTL